MLKEQVTYVSARQLRDRYGGVSHMWIERRIATDPEFPKPVYFGARRFWPVAAIETWERLAAAKSPSGNRHKVEEPEAIPRRQHSAARGSCER